MTDSKNEALALLNRPAPAHTYTTVVRPHQLKRTDTLVEAVDGHTSTAFHRYVSVESVSYGEISYRGARVPVLFVTGTDRTTGHRVVYTRTSWEFLTVERIGEAPQYRSAEKARTQYVY
jgi:hypothetical protein